MCGIVGYLGHRQAGQILLDGLKRLEYRGYDSAGIAVVNPSGIQVVRVKGKLRDLEERLNGHVPQGMLGLGHTRWATHGKPEERNAHPHLACDGSFAVVHNGIIENYRKLKERLTGEGHRFTSETDTEVLVHLIEKRFRGDLPQAVKEALEEVEGSYALAVVTARQPDMIVAARYHSPLVVGLGEKEFFLASDIPAILSYTREQVTLEERELAIISSRGVSLEGLDNGERRRAATQIITWDAVQAEKRGYRHFMLKEIHEQPQAVAETCAGRASWEEGEVNFPECELDPAWIRGIDRIVLVACGTSYHAGLVGRYMLERWGGLPVEVDIASEFRYRSPILGPRVLTVAISQSGETADTIAAVREARERGSRVVCISNVIGSSITRESAGSIFTHAGPEIGVASTKAFTCQLAALYLLGCWLGQLKGTLSLDERRELLAELRSLPGLMEEVLRRESRVKELARTLKDKNNFLYLGRGINYPIALEGALKLKEISYIHAEGYPAGEMKHGPIALIDEKMPVVMLSTRNHVREKMMANMEEVRARDGIVVALATEGDDEVAKMADHLLTVPPSSATLGAVLLSIPLQLLAYHIGVLRGCDVDQPRNLAKSVTVE